MSSPNSVSHEIAAILRTEVLRGQYRVGERMPSERDLSASFNVSRGAVREALSQLEQQGIIETQPGGVRVKPIEEATLAILGPLLALEEIPDPDLVDQFLEIFTVLTRLTVLNAVKVASPEQLNQMQELLVEMSQHAKNFETMQPHWQKLLDFMSSINNNLVARLISNDVKAQFVERMMDLDINLAIKPVVGRELVKALDSAFKKQDEQLAAQAFEKHFDQLRSAIRSALENMRITYRKQAV